MNISSGLLLLITKYSAITLLCSVLEMAEGFLSTRHCRPSVKMFEFLMLLRYRKHTLGDDMSVSFAGVYKPWLVSVVALSAEVIRLGAFGT